MPAPTDEQLKAVQAARTIAARMAASDRDEEKGGASDDEIILSLLTLLDEAHRFIAAKVKNEARWPLGMLAFRMKLMGRQLRDIIDNPKDH